MSKKVKFSKPSGPFSEPYTGKISSKVDPIYDDVDIFEGGPAGQVLVDIDPLYGGIQLQEDELPGSQAMRDLARAGKEITDVFTPSEETKAEIEERDRKEQEAFAMLLKATGVEPETFEAGQLEGKLRRDAELRKLLNLPTGFFDRGLTDLRLGFATAGEFLSNGYRLRSTNASTNANGGDYVYMAFAKHPFVSSEGVPVHAE